MGSLVNLKRNFLAVIENIQAENELATMYPAGTFAEGIGDMHKYASYSEAEGKAVIRVEVSGTMYEGRSARIEHVLQGELVQVERDYNNAYSKTNLAVLNRDGESLGNMPSEVAHALSPLIDAGVAMLSSAKVSHVVPLSCRGKRARKALLYVEIEVTLKPMNLECFDGSVVCVLGGDHGRTWAQKLNIYYCAIPLEHAKCFFELYNRWQREYETILEDKNYGYVGLENLMKEILDAKEKMREEMVNGLDYKMNIETSTFGEYVSESIESDPKRYGMLKQYITEFECEFELKDVFVDKAVDRKTYYWLNRTQVGSAEWSQETIGGFYHWYEVMELYSPEDGLPFDLNDDFVSIFGFGKFVAFADLSYGC